jgi:hypothetical protein
MSDSIPNYPDRILTFLGTSAPLRFPPKSVSETLDYTWDLSQWLQSGETITGTPVVSIISTGTTLTTTSTTVNPTNLVLWLSGGSVYTDYTIDVVFTTSNTPARVKRFIAFLYVTDE